MEDLHGALCGYFLKLIDGKIPELVERTVTKRAEDGTESTEKTWVETGFMVRPSAGELAVMAKFLKDNAITGVAAEGSELSELEKKLAARHARRGKLPTEADAKQALREMGSDLLN
jgi:hypothetical protein